MAELNPVLNNGIAADQGIHEISTTQLHRIGTRARIEDQVFFYSKSISASALAPSKLLQVANTVANHDNQACLATAAGVKRINTTLGATLATANQYAEGWYVINDDGAATGEGHAYRIKSHPAIASAGTAFFELYDEVAVALTTASEYTLVSNHYNGVFLHAGGQTLMGIGVPCVEVPIGSTTPQYFWTQSGGPGIAWGDMAAAIGASLTAGTAAGQVETRDGIGDQVVGTVHSVTFVDTEYQPVNWTIKS